MPFAPTAHQHRSLPVLHKSAGAHLFPFSHSRQVAHGFSAGQICSPGQTPLHRSPRAALPSGIATARRVITHPIHPRHTQRPSNTFYGSISGEK